MRMILLGLLLGASLARAEGGDPLRTRLDTNREVIQTYAQVYLEQHDYARTEALLASYLQQDRGDGSLWVLLGQSQIESNRFAQACHAFQTASEVFNKPEDKTYALYLFADCLNRGEMQAEAVRILTELSKKAGGVTDISSRALEMIRNGELKAGQPLPHYVESVRGVFRVSGAFGAGFDSNVLLLNENVAANVPVGKRGSFFVNPAAQAGYLGRLGGQTFDSRYLLSFTDYANSSASRFNALYQRVDFILGSGERRWGLFGDLLFMNRDQFRMYDWTGGFSWNQRRKISASEFFDLEVPVRYQEFPADSGGVPENNRNGGGFQVRGRYRRLTSEQTVFMAQLALDSQWTSGRNYRESQVMLPLYWTFRMPVLERLGLINSLQAEANGQWFWGSMYGRKDLLVRVGAGLIRKWGGGWSTSLDGSWIRNL